MTPANKDFSPIDNIILEPLVRASLQEDLGRVGDITTNAIVAVGKNMSAKLSARKSGVVAGLDIARLAFQLMNPDINFKTLSPDGSVVNAGETIASVTGDARGILSAERVALNFLCRLSGIATATKSLVDAVKPYKAHICCTRKTTPTLRHIEKYAVRVGGGYNHRFGLDDAVLIKDNHIAAAGGIREAVMRACSTVGHMIKIELEVDNLDQLKEALGLPIDAVLLDNMDNPTLSAAVELVNKRFVTEASGNVTLASVAAIAASGVDIISAGWITHSAPILDIGLDVE